MVAMLPPPPSPEGVQHGNGSDTAPAAAERTQGRREESRRAGTVGAIAGRDYHLRDLPDEEAGQVHDGSVPMLWPVAVPNCRQPFSSSKFLASSPERRAAGRAAARAPASRCTASRVRSGSAVTGRGSSAAASAATLRPMVPHPTPSSTGQSTPQNENDGEEAEEK